jgi:HAD superfamily hydrolase (TIGR01509 family)
MKGKLVIFDLDGVLVDACEWHRAALNEALKEVCDGEISMEEHISIFNGIPTRVKLKKLTELGRIPEASHDAVYNLKQSKTVEIIERDAFVRKEKQEMILALKGRGAKIACYTNSIRQTTKLMLEKTGILDMFDYVLTNQDVEKCKPDPEGYIFLMNHLGFSKENTFIIEDSPKGLKAANDSGANVIQVRDPNEVSIELFDIGAKQ